MYFFLKIVVAVDTKTDVKPKLVKTCSLDKTTQELVKLIFDNDMFNNAMKGFDIGKDNRIRNNLFDLYISDV